MARTGTLPQFKATAARLRLLLFVLTVYTLEFVALSGKNGSAFILGCVLWFAIRLVAIALTLAIGAALGGQVLWLTIGLGPRVSRSVIGNQVRVVRLLPIAVGGVLMPKAESYPRSSRIFIASGLLLPALLAGVAAPMVHGYAALTIIVLTAAVLVFTATTRDAVAGRMAAARLLLRATKHSDPMFTCSDRIRASRSVCVDVYFGDLGPAEALLMQLRAEPGAEFGAALLATELLAARGDYDGALRVAFPEPDPDDTAAVTESRHAADSARAAKLLMLVAEKDPTLAAKAVPLAQRHVAAMANNRFAPRMDRAGRALVALQTGDLHTANRENRICLARARAPLALADALCTQARIDAQGDQPEKAVKRLDEAAKFAPWYPRVATVRQLVGADVAAALPQPVIVSAQTDTSHVFAEPWSVAAPASDEG